MTPFLTVLILSAQAFGIAAASDYRPFVVFGDDDRKDLHEVTDARQRRAADGTVAFFHRDKVSMRPSRREVSVDSEKYGKKFGLCRDEKFADQSAASDFSGVLVAPDLVLTAGHVMRTDRDCAEFLVIFGYHQRADLTRLPIEEVFECSAIVTRRVDRGADYALIRLKSEVRGHRPVPVNRDAGKIAVDSPLTVLGFPNGLPLKVAGDARVRRWSEGAFFEADTDTFNGNSGSPVIHSETGLLEGILVDGSEDDFVFDRDRGCNRHHRCRQNECRSEIINSVSVILPWL